MVKGATYIIRVSIFLYLFLLLDALSYDLPLPGYDFQSIRCRKDTISLCEDFLESRKNDVTLVLLL